MPDDKILINDKGAEIASKMRSALLAVVLFSVILWLPHPEVLSREGWMVIAVGVCMLTLWVTEAVPIPVTAILPIFLFPSLDLMTIKHATANYSHPIVFLFMGGFIIALAMEKWKLHLRIALFILRLTGTHANGIVAGFMLATAFLSMWMSNTATTVMMLPIAMSVLNLLFQKDITSRGLNKNQQYFALSLMIGVAYAANIGGTATLIGTPPNAILAGYLSDAYEYQISFSHWFMIGFPFTIAMLLVCWLLLTLVIYPSHMGRLSEAGTLIDTQWRELGPMHPGEKRVLVIFVLTALLWMFKGFIPFISLSDTSVAIAAAIALFVTPTNLKTGQFILEWSDTSKLPWGVLLLFGGGLTLASAMQSSGLIQVIGDQLSGGAEWGMLPLVIITICVVLFMTEMMSNLALITIFLPVLAGMSFQLLENPLFFMIPATLAASCAFMLPMSTPPNAIVFASGYIKVPQMIKAGVVMNVISVLFITIAAYSIIQYVFGIELGAYPDWAKR